MSNSVGQMFSTALHIRSKAESSSGTDYSPWGGGWAVSLNMAGLGT